MKTISLAAGTTHVRFDEIPALYANALWPDDGSMDELLFLVNHGGTQLNVEVELKRAVTMQKLPVKDPLTFGPHCFPVGQALKSALVAIDDLRAYVADRGITVVVGHAPEPQAAPVTAMSVMDAPASEPLPVTTGNIAHAFNGLRSWDEKAWKDTLGTPPKWLQACIVIPGRRGVHETRWNPVLIGAALVGNGHARPNSIRAKFQTVHHLRPWLDAWKAYEADNFDTA